MSAVNILCHELSKEIESKMVTQIKAITQTVVIGASVRWGGEGGKVAHSCGGDPQGDTVPIISLTSGLHRMIM